MDKVEGVPQALPCHRVKAFRAPTMITKPYIVAAKYERGSSVKQNEQSGYYHTIQNYPLSTQQSPRSLYVLSS